MGDGEMVSTNRTIYLNPYVEMVKIPLISVDMVKACLTSRSQKK